MGDDEAVTMILDAHTHIGPSYHALFHRTSTFSASELLAGMDKAGVAMAVVFPGGYWDEVESYYQMVRAAVKEFPSRFVGFYRINPHLGQKALSAAEKAVREDGMRGFKLHPQLDLFVANSALVNPVMEKARELNVPVLFHTGDMPYALPSQVAEVASCYPDVPVIMGHMGKTEIYQDAATSARRAENIFLETSGCSPRNVIQGAINSVGAERVLFGSDWPAMSIKGELAKIYDLNLSDDEMEKVLGGNMRRILGMTL